MSEQFYYKLYMDWKKKHKEGSWYQKRPWYNVLCLALFLVFAALFVILGFIVTPSGDQPEMWCIIAFFVSFFGMLVFVIAFALIDTKWTNDHIAINADNYLDYCAHLHDELKKNIYSIAHYKNVLGKIKEARADLEKNTKRPNNIANAAFVSIIFALMISVIPSILDFYFSTDFDIQKVQLVCGGFFILCVIYAVAWGITYFYAKSENKRIAAYKAFERDLQTIIELESNMYKDYQNRIQFDPINP